MFYTDIAVMQTHQQVVKYDFSSPLTSGLNQIKVFCFYLYFQGISFSENLVQYLRELDTVGRFSAIVTRKATFVTSVCISAQSNAT